MKAGKRKTNNQASRRTHSAGFCLSTKIKSGQSSDDNFWVNLKGLWEKVPFVNRLL